MDPTYSIKTYLSPFPNKIIKAKTSDHIGPTLARTKSSHEAVYVYDESGNFAGLISAHQAFLFKRCPYFAHIEKCLFKPPHITEETPIYTVCDMMLFNKVYNLPVFKGDKIKFIVDANKLLNNIMNSPELLEKLNLNTMINKPIIAKDSKLIKTIYNKLLRNKISRVILVDREGDLSGIVSRRDIEDALIVKPPRNRFRNRQKGLKYTSFFDQEKIKKLDAPVAMFATKKVVVAAKNSPLRWILAEMIKSGKNSVVIVDGLKPVGFISRHDLLKALASLKPRKDIPIIWEDSEHDIGEYTRLRMLTLLKRFGLRYSGRSAIRRMEVHVDAIKNSAYYDKIYYIRLHVNFESGRLAFAYVETRNLIIGTQRAIKKIENQYDLSDRQKHSIY